MITYIEGRVLNIESSDKYSTVEVVTTSGVGYEIFMPVGEVSLILNQEIVLHISHVVREDSQTLYGFISRNDRRVFQLLTTVSGIGPKGAISIMSRYSSSQIAKLVKEGDHKSLSQVSGLGSKGAQKIVVELKDKLDWLDSSDYIDSNDEVLEELKTALKSLGFDNAKINDSLSTAKDLLKENKYTLEQLIKYVLSE